MYKNKKIITLILTLAFIGLIGGCGKTTSENNSDDNNKEATQEASLVVNDEETNQEMNANMKEVSVKPLMDIFDNIWGRKIDEWNIDELASQFGMEEGGGDGFETVMWFTKYNPLGEGNRYLLMTGFGDCDFFDFTYEYYNYAKYGINRIVDAQIYFDKGTYRYEQRIVSSSHDVMDNEIYQFCVSNGLTSIEGVMEYFGIDENDFAEAEHGTIRTNTEMGLGSIDREVDDSGKCKSIYVWTDQHGGVTFSLESEIYDTNEEGFVVKKDYFEAGDVSELIENGQQSVVQAEGSSVVVNNIEILPFVELLEEYEVWGKPWTEWTADDVIQQFDLQMEIDGVWRSSDPNMYKSCYLATTTWLIQDNVDTDKHSYRDKLIAIDEEFGEKFYEKTVSSQMYYVEDDEVVEFCRKNDITDMDGVLEYFGLENRRYDITSGEGIELSTEFGNAIVSGQNVQDGIGCISIHDFEERPNLSIGFYNTGFQDEGMTEFSIRISLK